MISGPGGAPPRAILCWPPCLEATPANGLVRINVHLSGGPEQCGGPGGGADARRAAGAASRAPPPLPPPPLTLLALSGGEVIAEQRLDCPWGVDQTAIRLDLPAPHEPGALHLMLAEPPDPSLPCDSASQPGFEDGEWSLPPAPQLPPLVHHLASLPVLPPPAAAEARRLLLLQIAAAPEGANAALRCLSGGGGDGDGGDPPAGGAVPRRWSPPPTGPARHAVAWAWREHFAPFAQDLCHVLSGPGPPEARAALLESLLRFAAACGMTDTALLMLRACASQGVITQVHMPPRGCGGGGGAAGGAFGAIPAPGLAGLGFVVGDSAAAFAPPPAAAAAADEYAAGYAASAAAGATAEAPPKRRRRSLTDVLLGLPPPGPGAPVAWRGAAAAVALVALLTAALLTAPVFGDFALMLYS